MARTTTPTSGRKKPGAARGAKQAVGRKAAAPAAAVRKAPAGRKPAVAKPTRGAAAKPARSTTAAPASAQSKQELRDRIEKLERANAVLRIKNREAIEASREAANRVDELEEQLAAASTTAPEPTEKPKPSRRGRKPKVETAATPDLEADGTDTSDDDE